MFHDFGPDRDLSDPRARSGAGAQCLVEYRNECEARAEVDCWPWGWTPATDTEAARAIDRQATRTHSNIFRRSHE